MNFGQAFLEMRKGNGIRLKSWHESIAMHIIRNDGVEDIVFSNAAILATWVFNTSDVLSDDWEVVDPADIQTPTA